MRACERRASDGCLETISKYSANVPVHASLRSSVRYASNRSRRSIVGTPFLGLRHRAKPTQAAGGFRGISRFAVVRRDYVVITAYTQPACQRFQQEPEETGLPAYLRQQITLRFGGEIAYEMWWNHTMPQPRQRMPRIPHRRTDQRGTLQLSRERLRDAWKLYIHLC